METEDDTDSYVVKTSAKYKLTMDIEIMKLFYACNLPFSIADHDQFVKVVMTLNPGYVPPSRIAVAGPLLDAVTEPLNEHMRADLQRCDNRFFTVNTTLIIIIIIEILWGQSSDCILGYDRVNQR